ncbi:MAG: hypothetical protein AB1586_26620 [Pseudomonadota bacterium]|jgi:hypothetical protein
MNIESRQLTTCSVAADGTLISLGFLDAAGRPASVNLPVEQAGSLAMTLPVLIQRALRQRYRDASLRYTFPLTSWRFERSSDPATTIVTLGTADGFGICFSIARELRSELGEALATPVASEQPLTAN